MSEQSNPAQTVREIMNDLHQVKILPATTEEFAVVPNGVHLESIKKFSDEYHDRPERRAGTANLITLQSFIDHANRFKDSDSVIFADRNVIKPTLTSVLDYHEACNTLDDQAVTGAAPRFGKHRGHYALPLSPEWKTWTESNDKQMDQVVFATFLEENILNVLPVHVLKMDDEADIELHSTLALLGGKICGPDRLMELARGLSIRESAKVTNVVNLSSGEGTVEYEVEHTDATGTKLSVPNFFCIGVPVFDGGDRYRLLVRLRYRKVGPAVMWRYLFYRADVTFRAAFDGACATATEKTGLPLLYGSPEVSV